MTLTGQHGWPKRQIHHRMLKANKSPSISEQHRLAIRSPTRAEGRADNFTLVLYSEP